MIIYNFRQELNIILINQLIILFIAKARVVKIC
jgi:hypothetical protein